ncbi:MAG: GTPase ObgE [bacterium]|nr:GTPase ObgE [bacterium]
MFADTAKVFIQAGKGGDGFVSFRHEVYVDKGGPDGGDGGKGGDIVFVASENVNTLVDFRFKPELKAEHGSNGSKRNKRGKSGEDLIVKVPIGTLVLRDGQPVADLTKDGQREIVAFGGEGGFGNAHFKSSVRQTPRMRELGETGDTFEANLELKLIADVGLVGFPNAGKSTFLSVVSNARPEVADYAFTTLTPSLGVADIDDTSLLIADIPGLIEGASEGKGLGDEFLRHVERTPVLLHLIDAYTDDISSAYQTIRNELISYSDDLANRPEVVALTKCEGLDADIINMQKSALQEEEPNLTVVAISSSAHQNIPELLRLLRTEVDAARVKDEAEAAETQAESEDDVPVIRLSEQQLAEGWSVTKQAGAYQVTGKKIERFADRTDFDNPHSINRLRDIMGKLGITHELIRQDASGESDINIGRHSFTLYDQYQA